VTDVAIRVDGLSKRYRIGERQRYKSLRESIMKASTGAFRRNRRDRHDTIWALRDVSFEVQQGEVIGIIGGNGAGKSTLLKILARITEPTEGRAEVRGRVGTLLEVGTGFHLELTGRENIFLSGAILGMRNAEIQRKFDEIVGFAEVEKFVDTPVKHYSSGMYLRLAFAVAAHLESDILLVDEVLAVGDNVFQRKCIGKMGDVARGGRTVLFVSHNLGAVRRICRKAVRLLAGRVHSVGSSDDVVLRYLEEMETQSSLADLPSRIAELPPDPVFRLLDVEITQEGRPTTRPANAQPFNIGVVFEVKRLCRGLRVFFDVCDENQEVLVRSFHDEMAETIPSMNPGVYRATATFPPNLLAPRNYLLVIQAGIFNVRYCIPTGLAVTITVDGTNGINRAYVGDPVRSKLQPLIPWSLSALTPAS
jgi:lipopolysaccharide transport system ATP-binding protein